MSPGRAAAAVARVLLLRVLPLLLLLEGGLRLERVWIARHKQTPAPRPGQQVYRVALLGKSILQGAVARLGQQLQRRLPHKTLVVDDLTLPVRTSWELVDAFERHATRHPPDLMVVMMGAMDHTAQTPTRPGQPSGPRWYEPALWSWARLSASDARDYGRRAARELRLRLEQRFTPAAYLLRLQRQGDFTRALQDLLAAQVPEPPPPAASQPGAPRRPRRLRPQLPEPLRRRAVDALCRCVDPQPCLWRLHQTQLRQGTELAAALAPPCAAALARGADPAPLRRFLEALGAVFGDDAAATLRARVEALLLRGDAAALARLVCALPSTTRTNYDYYLLLDQLVFLPLLRRTDLPADLEGRLLAEVQRRGTRTAARFLRLQQIFHLLRGQDLRPALQAFFQLGTLDQWTVFQRMLEASPADAARLVRLAGEVFGPWSLRALKLRYNELLLTRQRPATIAVLQQLLAQVLQQERGSGSALAEDYLRKKLIQLSVVTGRCGELQEHFARLHNLDARARSDLRVLISRCKPAGGGAAASGRPSAQDRPRPSQGTEQSWQRLQRYSQRQGVPLVALQYPTWRFADLRRLVQPDPLTVLVDNERSFVDAVAAQGYDALFRDRFIGSGGHLTPRGVDLLVDNVLAALERAQLLPGDRARPAPR